MSNKVFVGNLSWNTNDDSLKEFFSQFGTVTSATVITYRDTGRSKGFGFVEFDNEDAVKKAISDGNGKELDGRSINVNEARPQQPRENSFRQRNYRTNSERRNSNRKRY